MGENWRSHPLSIFCEGYRGKRTEDRKLPRKVRDFYKKQDKHIRDLESTFYFLECGSEAGRETIELEKKQQRTNDSLLKIAFVTNLLLLVTKLIASIISKSLSIISSLLDSVVDLATSLVLWFISLQMRKSQPYSYPQGRRRLEPITVIILSVFMSSASIQITIEALQAIYNMAIHHQGPPNVTDLTIGLVTSTIIVKVCLLFACWKFGAGQSVAALLNDQKNDCISNSAVLIFSTLSSRLPRFTFFKYLDPAGAIVISIYIVYSWWKMGAEHTRNLSGHSADPSFIQKIGFISLNHHAAIERLDTVRAVHFGNNYLVEVDIVLPHDMDLHTAHDIGETLQKNLERLPDVERAFVHLDYESTHHPSTEHKIG